MKNPKNDKPKGPKRKCDKLQQIRILNDKLLSLEKAEFQLLQEIRDLEQRILAIWNSD